MGLVDSFYGRFNDVYANPDVVMIAFTLIVFVMVYSVLVSKNLFGNKQMGIVITLIISLIFLGYFRDLQVWLAAFNVLLVGAVLVVIGLIAWSFFKGFRTSFPV